MEKMNESLEGFLREITPYSGRPFPFSVAFADKYSYDELVKKRTFIQELEAIGMLKTTEGTAPVASTIDRYATVEFPDYFTLTSQGETYFNEIEKRERLETEARKLQWRHDIAVALISGGLGFLGGIAGALFSFAQGWLN
ncbi:hypothetical protein [Paraeggerthella hongkongensis]|uniref:Uncharacterized protein n=1 Tax=Paraeggerthella hongkongensis TaxID=230658 RepID=A0A3N0BBP6_9ACTN|nr:hypothetical protein [Paraeggerthella hongkongensis]RNL44759.1 hypothetical protein DMP08_06090 [Paraeggerthella hongkongensis]